jgi:hypothetical protein
MRRIDRRLMIAGLAGALLSVALPAQAGSYLDRAALLVKQSSHEADYLRARLSDLELAEVIKQIAAARVQAASKMQVPKEVAQAHPHLLMVLQNYERAATAAADGKPQRFLVLQQRARDEERILRGVLKQLGWSLPQA